MKSAEIFPGLHRNCHLDSCVTDSLLPPRHDGNGNCKPLASSDKHRNLPERPVGIGVVVQEDLNRPCDCCPKVGVRPEESPPHIRCRNIMAA